MQKEIEGREGRRMKKTILEGMVKGEGKEGERMCMREQQTGYIYELLVVSLGRVILCCYCEGRTGIL